MILLLSFLLSSMPVHAAGTDVGNGGDVANCVAATGSGFLGLHSADFLLTLGPNDQPLTPDARVTSLDQSLRRIQDQLTRLHPAMAKLFAAYVAELRNFTDWTRARIWTPSGQGLIDIRDERLVRRLPANCTGGSEPNVAHLIQAVVRQARPRTVQYQVDFELVERLAANPLQYSYLIVHEWLWDFSSDPEAIRWANRLLHSAAIERMEADSFRANLDGIGVTMANYGYDRFCTRSPVVRGTLENLLGTPCDSMTLKQLQDLNPLTTPSENSRFLAIRLDSMQLDELHFGDFTGLSHLKMLNLSSNALEELDGDIFAGLTALEDLDLSKNRLTEAPARIFDVLPQLKRLKLSLNRIQTLPEKFLREAFALSSLSVDRNQLTELPVDLLRAQRIIGAAVNLFDNKISALPQGFFDSVPTEAGSSSGTDRVNLYLGRNPISQAAAVRGAEGRRVNFFFNDIAPL